MRVLITGGTGYIGSHTVLALLNAGHEVTIVDNLCNSNENVVERIAAICGNTPKFYRTDVRDAAAMRNIFAESGFEAVIHFAGLKAVGESCKIPLQYYRNNLDSTLTLLECMDEFGCKKIVFSSSATVYGPNNPVPYTEDMPVNTATNPYGRTKVMIEQILRDVCAADPEFSAVLLRYFNPIGGHPSGLLGDDPNGIPNNLMPYLVRVAAGKLPKLTVFGNDYDTTDGTCLRDYIHVVDLARGHLKALDYDCNGAEAFNIGTGKGTSVLELIETFSRVNNIAVPYVIGARRDGDLASCWANVEKAERLLGWKAELTLEDMCRDSWRFICRDC